MIWMAALSAASKYSQGQTNAKINKANLKTKKKMAELEGKKYALRLTEDYNQAMASDVVMSYAQGRSGGSVQGISNAASKQFNWDLDMADFAVEMNEMGYNNEIEAVDRARNSLLATTATEFGMDSYSEYSKWKRRQPIKKGSK